MNDILFIVLFYLAWIGFNSIISIFLINKLRHPKYYLEEDFNFYENIFLFVGLPMLLFRNRIKHKSMHKYLEYSKTHIKRNTLNYGINGVYVTKEEIYNLDRYLKLKKLKRKSFVKRKLFHIFVFK